MGLGEGRHVDGETTRPRRAFRAVYPDRESTRRGSTGDGALGPELGRDGRHLILHRQPQHAGAWRAGNPGCDDPPVRGCHALRREYPAGSLIRAPPPRRTGDRRTGCTTYGHDDLLHGSLPGFGRTETGPSRGQSSDLIHGGRVVSRGSAGHRVARHQARKPQEPKDLRSCNPSSSCWAVKEPGSRSATVPGSCVHGREGRTP